MSIKFTPAEAAKPIDTGNLAKRMEVAMSSANTNVIRCIDCQKVFKFEDKINGELVWDNSEYWQTGHKTPYCRECYSRRFGDSSNG